jgi:hypothetical protein
MRRKGSRRLTTDNVRENHTSQYEGATVYHCRHCEGGGGEGGGGGGGSRLR